MKFVPIEIRGDKLNGNRNGTFATGKGGGDQKILFAPAEGDVASSHIPGANQATIHQHPSLLVEDALVKAAAQDDPRVGGGNGHGKLAGARIGAAIIRHRHCIVNTLEGEGTRATPRLARDCIMMGGLRGSVPHIKRIGQSCARRRLEIIVGQVPGVLVDPRTIGGAVLNRDMDLRMKGHSIL